ncbi:MAG TPA: hypothetical protein VJY42_02005 [Candidatus Methanomethylophilaceae archaeon]|nr:hypothetical protein [Candidatus Methanomethylophilaceae archaeon]
MKKILVVPKISKGYRIALTKELCERIGVNEGERLVISENDAGDIVLRPQKAVS